MKTDKKLIGAGLLTAIAASLCCITPVLALIAGTSGLASTFSWLEPFRPYFIGLTILVLGFAWYQKLNLKSKLTATVKRKKNQNSFSQKCF
jgi:mercuric ion transport protein